MTAPIERRSRRFCPSGAEREAIVTGPLPAIDMTSLPSDVVLGMVPRKRR